MCGPVPNYGAGDGGWRRELAQAGNRRARLGVGNPGGFFSGLLGMATAVDPTCLLRDLPTLEE